MTEEWRDIPNYEGLYQVSNLGRVRSLDRMTYRFDPLTNSNTIERPLKGKVLKINNAGRYSTVDLSKHGVRKNTPVGHCVLNAFKFISPKYSYNLECSHLDGNTRNNKLSNLEWETHKQNMDRKKEHGTIPRGEKCGASKVSLEQVKLIKKHITKGLLTQEQIASLVGTTRTIVGKIKINKTWTHVPWPTKEAVDGEL